MAKDDNKEYPNIIVFDLETGGFSPTQHPIIEIAVLCINNKMEEIARKEWIILPYNDQKVYTPGAFQANGFTMGEITKRGIESSIVLAELVIFLKEQKLASKPFISYSPDSKPVLAGHNIDAFDIPFLIEFFKEHESDLYKFISKKVTLDTLPMSRLFFGYSGYTHTNHKLETCCRYIGFPIVNAHKAMNDVEGNVKLLKHFIEGARGLNNNSGQDREIRERDTFKLS